jgi:hypothetical protein
MAYYPVLLLLCGFLVAEGSNFLFSMQVQNRAEALAAVVIPALRLFNVVIFQFEELSLV